MVLLLPFKKAKSLKARPAQGRHDQPAASHTKPLADAAFRALSLEALWQRQLTIFYAKDFTILNMNEAATAFFIGQQGEQANLCLVDLIHPSHRDIFLHEAEFPMQKRAQFRHYDGSYQWYGLYYTPHPEGMLLVMEPVEPLVNSEKQLRKAQMEVEYSIRERGEFLRHMSHELRTPLNAMMGFARMMEEGVFGAIDNEVYQEYLHLISQSGEDLLDKIVDLMDLSAIGSHVVSLHETTVKAHDVLDSCLQGLQNMAITRGITIQVNHARLPLELEVDHRLLRKSLAQIIQNAIEYNQSGGWVQIDTLYDEQQGYHIIIRDNGYGIQRSQLRALQQALHDSSSLYSHVEAYRPIGLGLTLAKEYIHLHGGDILIESQIGEGTQVTITLPVRRINLNTQTEYTSDAAYATMN